MKSHTGMMIAVALAALLLAGTAGPAHALGGFLAYQNSDEADDGVGLGLKHKYQIVPIFAAEARATWLAFGDESFGGDTASLNAFPLEAVARAKLGLFYLGLGVGYTFFGGPDIKPDGTVHGVALGGAEFTLLGLGGFAELAYRVIEPEVAGHTVDMSGMGANVGVLIRR